MTTTLPIFVFLGLMILLSTALAFLICTSRTYFPVGYEINKHQTHKFCRQFSIQNVENLIGFDADFAEMVSKPLPDWYVQENIAREKLKRELEENRENILQEFRKKYIVTEERKKIEYETKKRNKIEKWEKKKKDKSMITSFLEKVGIQKSVEIDLPDESSTQENWEKFLIEEEESTVLALPGFFEVFPELKFKWPIWSKKKNGSAIKCERDQDCPFPQACCPHPIFPGEKFCCTGWGQRVMEPAYQTQEIQSARLPEPKPNSNPF